MTRIRKDRSSRVDMDLSYVQAKRRAASSNPPKTGRILPSGKLAQARRLSTPPGVIGPESTVTRRRPLNVPPTVPRPARKRPPLNIPPTVPRPVRKRNAR